MHKIDLKMNISTWKCKFEISIKYSQNCFIHEHLFGPNENDNFLLYIEMLMKQQNLKLYSSFKI